MRRWTICFYKMKLKKTLAIILKAVGGILTVPAILFLCLLCIDGLLFFKFNLSSFAFIKITFIIPLAVWGIIIGYIGFAIEDNMR